MGEGDVDVCVKGKGYGIEGGTPNLLVIVEVGAVHDELLGREETLRADRGLGVGLRVDRGLGLGLGLGLELGFELGLGLGIGLRSGSS